MQGNGGDTELCIDGMRVLVLGKNRDPLSEGTIVTLVYNIPPTDAWSLTPLVLTGEAVDAVGTPIEVVTSSGWLGIDEGSD